MAMAMASDYWEVVGDVRVDVTELAKNECPFTTSKFRMLFDATIRRVTSDEGDRLLDDDVIPRVITKRAYIEFDGWNSSYMDEAISETLRQRLLVPMEERSSMVEKVMIKACETAQRLGPYAGGKVVRMKVDIDFYVIDDDVDEDSDGGFGGIIGDDYEPRFVPASTSSIEKLEKTRVEVSSTVCSVCMDEIRVGFEATKMPCAHLYHEACIVGWLQQSGVCPLCKFRMPNQQDQREIANAC